MSWKFGMVLPILQRSNSQKHVYRFFIDPCMVALTKTSFIVVEMKHFGTYKINAIYGDQLYGYLVVRVKKQSD